MVQRDNLFSGLRRKILPHTILLALKQSIDRVLRQRIKSQAYIAELNFSHSLFLDSITGARDQPVKETQSNAILKH